MNTALSSVLSLFGLWFLLAWLARNYGVARFRQSMFEVRDDLFLYAAMGHISFDHPAYGLLRTLANGYLRFGHRLSIFSVLLFHRAMNHDERAHLLSESFSAQWEKAVEGLSPEVRGRLEHARRQIDLNVSRHLVLGSPLLLASVIPAVLAVLFVDATRKLWRRLLQRTEFDMDAAALVIGAA